MLEAYLIFVGGIGALVVLGFIILGIEAAVGVKKMDPLEVMQGPTRNEKLAQEEIKRLLLEKAQLHQRIQGALDLVAEHQETGGSHHLRWVIDQMVRQLLEDEKQYHTWVSQREQGEDGPETYEWQIGTPP